MKPETVNNWIAAMIRTGRAKSQDHCSRMLGYTAAKEFRTARHGPAIKLAMIALLNGFEGDDIDAVIAKASPPDMTLNGQAMRKSELFGVAKTKEQRAAFYAERNRRIAKGEYK